MMSPSSVGDFPPQDALSCRKRRETGDEAAAGPRPSLVRRPTRRLLRGGRRCPRLDRRLALLRGDGARDDRQRSLDRARQPARTLAVRGDLARNPAVGAMGGRPRRAAAGSPARGTDRAVGARPADRLANAILAVARPCRARSGGGIARIRRRRRPPSWGAEHCSGVAPSRGPARRAYRRSRRGLARLWRHLVRATLFRAG